MRWLISFIVLWAAILLAPLQAQMGPSPQATLSPPGWVFPNALVDLDFANQRYWRRGGATTIDQMITTTRLFNQTCTSIGGYLNYVPPNTPCITDNGLLSYITGTNLALQSQFGGADATPWTTTANKAVLTANAAVSPDQTVDAATLIEDSTAASTHFTTQSVTKAASSISYIFSVYGKSSSTRRIDLVMDDALGNGVIFVCDLAGQQVGVAAAGLGTPWTNLSSAVDAYSNGWTRCRVTATSNTATTVRAQIYLDNGTGTGAASRTYNGDGTSGATIFGAQLEVVGQATVAASPYIPTTTATATRNGDIHASPIILNGWNGTNKPLLSTYSAVLPLSAIANSGAQDIFVVNNQSTANRYIHRRNATDGVPTVIFVRGASTQFTASIGSGVNINVPLVIAGAWQTSQQILAANGTISNQTAAQLLLQPAEVFAFNVGGAVTATQQCMCYVRRVAIMTQFIGNIVDYTQ